MKKHRTIFLHFLGAVLCLIGFFGARSSALAQPGDEVDQAIELAINSLLARQHATGYWAGNITMSSRHTAYYIIASNYVGIFDQPYYDMAITWLAESQDATGTWGQTVAESPASLSNTAAALLALELAGVSPETVDFTSGQEYITRHGGIEAADPLVQAMYALFGKGDWNGPALAQFNTQLLLAPGTPPETMRSFPPWWREGFVPVTVLRTLHQNNDLSLVERQGLEKAETWLLSHQLADGSWFTGYPTFFAIMALHDLDGTAYRPQIEDGFRFLRSLQLPDGVLRPFELSVWDTSLAVLALHSGGVSACDPALQPTIKWLVSTQSPGGLDLSEAAPGGWSYNANNLIYPDSDDTSLALLAMSQMVGRSSHTEYARQTAVAKAEAWLLFMQGEDGGWATFLQDDDQENDADLPTGIEDTSIPDVTGHVLSALGAMGYAAGDPEIDQAIAYLQRAQTEQGSWYGRWGLSYLYGTTAVLVGLHDVEADRKAPFVQTAVAWLRDQQNEDGGWGEAFSSWDQSRGISYTAPAASTPEQTAWGVMGLLAAGLPRDDPALVAGVKYLLTSQTENGDWPGNYYTVLGIDPYTNDLYASHWPLLALGEYRQQSSAEDCTSYKVTYQQLPTPVAGGPALGGPVDLSFTLTPEGRNEARLWVENNGRYAARSLQLTAPDINWEWQIDELEAGSRLSQSIPTTNPTLQVTYLDVTGQPHTLTQAFQSVSPGFWPWKMVLGSVGAVIFLGGLAWLGVVVVRQRPLFLLGVRNLRQHRLRTVLTSTGVVLGTAAIGATLTLTLAFRNQLTKDFATFGTNRLLVLPYQLEVRFGPPTEGLRVQPKARLDDDDVDGISSLSQVIGASPFAQEDLPVTVNGQTLQMTVQFVEPETFLDVSVAQMGDGRFLTESAPDEVVVGYAVAQDAFARPLSVGDELTIDGNRMTVVGTMDEVGGIRGRLETIVSPDITIYTPLAEATKFTGRDYYDGIEVRVEDSAVIETVTQQLETIINTHHANTEFSIISSQRLLSQVDTLLAQFTAIVTVISLLTLIVSGIGVANMLLVGIRERIDEIGIMKALGASDTAVMRIFLAEAASIGLISAVLGSMLGFMLLLLLQWIAGVSVLPVAPYLLLFALVFSLLITVGCGSYPAYVAARLQPVEAIRRGG